MSNANQITGNIGLYHVARELSREGWNVMPTVRNARSADLYAALEDERTIRPIQIKTHSGKPNDMGLDLRSRILVTPWWVFVVFAKTQNISCYVFKLDEILQLKVRDPGTRSGKPENERKFWFPRKYYTPGNESERTDRLNAWHLLRESNAVS